VLAATTATGVATTASAQTIQDITTFNIASSGTFVTTPPSANATGGNSVQVRFTAATAGHESGFKGVFQPFGAGAGAIVHFFGESALTGNGTADKIGLGSGISGIAHATGLLSGHKNRLLAQQPGTHEILLRSETMSRSRAMSALKPIFADKLITAGCALR